jgi:hypothetical protein
LAEQKDHSLRFASTPTMAANNNNDDDNNNSSNNNNNSHIINPITTTTATTGPPTTVGPQGHSCCYVGCDMRRAVFLVNVLGILIMDMGGWILFSIPSSDNNHNDGIMEEEEDSTTTTTIGSSWLIPAFVVDEQPEWLFRTRMTLATDFLFHLLSLSGAYYYQDWKLAIATAWYMLITVIPMVWAVLRFHEETMTTTFLMVLLVGGVGWNGWGMIYPHAMLLQEIRHGIMTPETYLERERHWCSVVGG